MQPLAKQITYGLCAGALESTMTRVPWTSCMPSGSVTRRIFFGSPSGSMMDAAVMSGNDARLGAGVRALQAELGPGRVNQLTLLVGGLGACRGGTSRRR